VLGMLRQKDDQSGRPGRRRVSRLVLPARRRRGLLAAQKVLHEIRAAMASSIDHRAAQRARQPRHRLLPGERTTAEACCSGPTVAMYVAKKRTGSASPSHTRQDRHHTATRTGGLGSDPDFRAAQGKGRSTTKNQFVTRYPAHRHLAPPRPQSSDRPCRGAGGGAGTIRAQGRE